VKLDGEWLARDPTQELTLTCDGLQAVEAHGRSISPSMGRCLHTTIGPTHLCPPCLWGPLPDLRDPGGAGGAWGPRGAGHGSRRSPGPKSHASLPLSTWGTLLHRSLPSQGVC